MIMLTEVLCVSTVQMLLLWQYMLKYFSTNLITYFSLH